MCAAFRSHRKSATSSGSRSRPSARQFNRDVLTLDEAGYTCTAANIFEDRMNRRSLLGSSLLTIAALLKWPRSIGATLADDKSWRHGVSLFGDLKYPAGFRHFDYVNADAPKGGTAREAVAGTFDNFNGVVAG